MVAGSWPPSVRGQAPTRGSSQPLLPHVAGGCLLEVRSVGTRPLLTLGHLGLIPVSLRPWPPRRAVLSGPEPRALGSCVFSWRIKGKDSHSEAKICLFSIRGSPNAELEVDEFSSNRCQPKHRPPPSPSPRPGNGKGRHRGRGGLRTGPGHGKPPPTVVRVGRQGPTLPHPLPDAGEGTVAHDSVSPQYLPSPDPALSLSCSAPSPSEPKCWEAPGRAQGRGPLFPIVPGAALGTRMVVTGRRGH